MQDLFSKDSEVAFSIAKAFCCFDRVDELRNFFFAANYKPMRLEHVTKNNSKNQLMFWALKFNAPNCVKFLMEELNKTGVVEWESCHGFFWRLSTDTDEETMLRLFDVLPGLPRMERLTDWSNDFAVENHSNVFLDLAVKGSDRAVLYALERGLFREQSEAGDASRNCLAAYCAIGGCIKSLEKLHSMGVDFGKMLRIVCEAPETSEFKSYGEDKRQQVEFAEKYMDRVNKDGVTDDFGVFECGLLAVSEDCVGMMLGVVPSLVKRVELFKDKVLALAAEEGESVDAKNKVLAFCEKLILVQKPLSGQSAASRPRI